MGAVLGAILVGAYFYYVPNVATAAARRGRSWVAWFFIAGMLSPLIGYLLLEALGHPYPVQMEELDEENTNVEVPKQAPAPSRIKEVLPPNIG